MYLKLRCFDLWFWQVNTGFEEYQNPAISITYHHINNFGGWERNPPNLCLQFFRSKSISNDMLRLK